MKKQSLFLNQTAQSAVEYLLMFAAVSIVVFTALAPNGFFTRSVNESLNTSILDGVDHMAHCVCYESSTGDPCPAVCGNGCCEEGEIGSCPADCEGDSYHWESLGWGPCIPVCGSGTRTQVVHCVRDSDGTIVSDGHCSGAKPSTTEACSGEDCNYYWRESGYGQCSALCGPGTQTMTYECVRGYDGQVVYNSNCASLPAPPDLSQACDLGQCCNCEYVSACTDGSIPCCGVAGCGELEHSEIQNCTPTGCINPSNLQARCTADPACCTYADGACRESPCGWNERKYIETCGDGSTREVCFEDNTCVLACEGTEIVAHGSLCEDDNWGLTSEETYHTVDDCTDGTKCEILCDTDHNYYADGGLCVCQPPVFSENDYTNTAQGAGGSASYTSTLYDQEVDWYVDVWTEDLNYRMWFYDETGTEIAFFSNGCCALGSCCCCNDGDGNIDHATRSYTAYGVKVYVKEGGSASSGSFGWNITGQFTTCSEEDCVPSCAGACGGDGCGGSCGSCSYPDVCNAGTCECFPRCPGTDPCGDDGCGGDCGSCSATTTCYGGNCVQCNTILDATQCNNTADCYYSAALSRCVHN